MSKLICLSGLDGSGKTTQVELMKNHLQSYGLQVGAIHLKHTKISMSTIKEMCRKYIEEQSITDPNTVRNVFSAINFVEKVSSSVIPSINENDVTIVNRYTDSAKCYHFLKNGLSDYIDDIFSSLPLPTYNLFINVPPDICFTRIKSRISLNEFESLPCLIQAFEFYLSREANFIWIDGTGSEQSVFNCILKVINF